MGDHQWQKGRLVGDGTFGSVYIGFNPETGAVCAMKEIRFLHYDPTLIVEFTSQLQQEIKDLSQFKNPNIIEYYGSEIVDDRLMYIYMEYAHHGSISKYVLELGAMTEPVVRSFTRHIVSGLAYLHSMNIMHRDIKGSNLLVDASGAVKLADVGMAKHLAGLAGGKVSVKASLYWMAPELMQALLQRDSSSESGELTLSVDIWSLGCTVIEMFTGKPPWSEYEMAAAMFKIMQKRNIPSIPGLLSDDGKDFLGCCFRINPAERASAATLLEHPFLRNS